MGNIKVEEIKVGVIDAFSGPFGTIIKNNFKRAYDMAFEEMNNEGGIKSLGGAKLKMLIGDSKGLPEVGFVEAERLCKEGVVANIGCFQSSVTIAASEASEKNRTPFLTLASSDSISERGFRYVFVQAAKVSWFVRDLFRCISYLSEKTGIKPKTSAIMYETSIFGSTVNDAFKKYSKELGIEIVAGFPYDPTRSDVSDEIAKLKALEPDLFLAASFLEDSILITRTMKEFDFSPMVYITFPAPYMAEFVQSLGKLAEHIVLIAPGFNYDMKCPRTEEINLRYKKRYGVDMNAPAALAYSAIYILKDALERAAKIDKEVIRESIARTRISAQNSVLAHGIEFDETGQNKQAFGLALQIIEGEKRTIWPLEIASVSAVWPRPK